MKNSLSARGLIASTKVLRKDFELFFEASQNLYHKDDNPEGVFTLNVAENVLSWPIFKNKIENISSSQSIPDWVSGYTSCLGHPEFREAIASFFTKHLCRCSINPESLAVSAGATAIIEMTSYLLCDPGDVAVIPAPGYPVYSMDIGNKAEVERYDLITHVHVEELTEGPPMDIYHLDKAFHEIKIQGKRFRMLILTSPDNPTGGIYPLERLKRIAEWCIDHKIHCVVNEIYGLSIIPDKHGITKTFNSFAQVIKQKESDYLHLWYSMSKDLGISGFRVGVLHSHNKTLLKAYDNYNAPHLVSNHTQWLLQQVLMDQEFVESYIEANKIRLGLSYHLATEVLQECKIPFAPAEGSLFIWMDMSEFLNENTKEEEEKLWEDIFHSSGVLLTPGEGFGHSKNGIFRLVYTCVTREELEVAMRRIKEFIKRKRSG
jgi:aspartate/methionine/tyrosine aminotransferase